MKKRTVVVTATLESAGSGAVMDGRGWRGVACFQPWRIEGGKERKDLLRVVLKKHSSSTRAVNDGGRLAVDGIYRFTLTGFAHERGMMPSGRLAGRFKKVGDDAPPPLERVKDARLGTLTRVKRSEEHSGQLKLLGRRVPISVWGSIEKASALYAKARRALPKVPDAIVKKLLPLANREWLDAPITAAELKRRLKLVDVSIDAKELYLSFDCGETFTEHGVSARVSASGRISDVGIA